MTGNQQFAAFIGQVQAETAQTMELILKSNALYDTLQGKSVDPQQVFVNYANDFWAAAHYVMGADYHVSQNEVDMFNLAFKRTGLYTTVERAREQSAKCKLLFEVHAKVPRALFYILEMINNTKMSKKEITAVFDRTIQNFGMILALIIAADGKRTTNEVAALNMVLENCVNYVEQELRMGYRLGVDVLKTVSAILSASKSVKD